MARQMPTSPYFTFVDPPPPSPAPIPVSTSIPPRYIRRQHAKSTEMVNFSKLDTNALIEAAVTPSTSQPKQQPKTLAYYTPEEPKPSETTSRKHNRRSDQKRLSEDSISGSDSSADTFVTGPSKKKQKQPVNDSDEDYDIPRRQIRSRGKSHAFTAKQISDDNYGDEDDTSDVSYVESPKPKVPFASRKTSTPSHKASTTSKPRKALGTRVPTRLEDAHPADKELFRMKTDGKPWKQIKPVWEKLMGKLTGASTLSVRYCKMRENFEKVDGNDDMRILKFKAKVEAELESVKWERVAKMMEDDGRAMTSKEVRLRFKEIEKNGFQVSTPISDEGMLEFDPADMDAIDRELAGLNDIGNTSDLTESETSDVDMSMDFGRQEDEVDDEMGGLTETEQQLIESFGEADPREDAELESNGPLEKVNATEEGALLGEGGSKLNQEAAEESHALSTKLEDGGRGEV